MARCLRCKAGNEWIEGEAPPSIGMVENEIREAEREAVMNIVRRHIHSSHFLRVKAAVDADAKTRGAT